MAGEMPDGWRMVPFGEMAHSINDRVDNPAEAGVDRYVGLEHLDPDTLHLHRWGLPTDVEATKLRFHPGDVIFGRRRAYQRKLAVADFEGICSAHALVLRARPETVVPEFLPVFMQSEVFFKRALQISVGSLSPTINWKTLAVQQFLLPPKEDQRRIADILWAADAAVERWRGAVQRAEFLETAESDRVFGVQPDARAESCRDLCDLVTVGIVVQPATFYEPGGVPALRSLNIFPNRFVLDDLVRLSHGGHALHKKSELRTGDVVVVRTGRPGDAAVVPDSMAGWNCIDAIIVRPGKRLRPQFLAAFLNSSVGRRAVGRASAGTAQQHFNVGALKRVQIPRLTLEQQDRALSALKEIQESRALLEKHRTVCSAARGTLRESLLATRLTHV